MEILSKSGLPRAEAIITQEALLQVKAFGLPYRRFRFCMQRKMTEVGLLTTSGFHR